ncbi:MAG: hypothetical protein JSR57_11355 [Verrucomicrobia bacterium]|nr:hypothetical protein [Verrucomicrobiota bacterium]
MSVRSSTDGAELHSYIPTPSLSDSYIIDQKTLDKAKDFVLQNQNRITRRDKTDPSFHFYQAKHCTAFSHSDFPGLVLKVMNTLQAHESKESINAARSLFACEGYRYCHALAAETIDLSDKKTLLVMEKAIGNTDEFAAQEEMEKEFELIDSNPEMAAKWQLMTREVAQATAKLGYWDSQRKNLIWDSQQGWSFIDFERIAPTKSNIETGLNRLVEIFPPQFVDEIYDAAAQSDVTLDKTRERAKTDRLAQFTFSRELSRWNTKKGLPRVLDIERWPSTSWERKILMQFEENRNRPCLQNYLPAQTELSWWQPFTSLLSWEQIEPDAVYKAVGEPIYLENRAAFEAALKNLESEGVIRTWEVSRENSIQPYLVSYMIYF